MEMEDLQNSPILQQLLEWKQRSSRLPEPLLLAVTVVLAAVSVAGVVGNALVIASFQRSGRSGQQNLFVQSLAGLDLCVCAVAVPATLYHDVWRGTATDASCKIFQILSCSLVTASAFLLCLIAADRFAVICFVPGCHATRRQAAGCIAAALLLGVAVGIPGGLSAGTTYSLKVQVGSMRSFFPRLQQAHCISDYTIISEEAVATYKKLLTVLFAAVLFVIMSLYSAIFCFVRRRRRRWKPTKQSQKQRKLSKKHQKQQKHRKQQQQQQQQQQQHSPQLMETDIDAALQLLNTNDDQVVEACSTAGNSITSTTTAAAGAAAEAATEAEARAAERSRKKPHIRTAKVVCVITMFYLLSYLPFFFSYHSQRASEHSTSLKIPTSSARSNSSAMEEEDGRSSDESGGSDGAGRSYQQLAMQILFYCYFINHAANPIIYGCMNSQFRQQVCHMFAQRRNRGGPPPPPPPT